MSTPKCEPLKHTIVISLTVEIMLALGAFEVEAIFILLNAQHSEWRNAIEPIVTNQNVSRMYVSEFREWNFHLYSYGNAHFLNSELVAAFDRRTLVIQGAVDLFTGARQ
jgi:hypothetical protein